MIVLRLSYREYRTLENRQKKIMVESDYFPRLYVFRHNEQNKKIN